MRIFRQSSHKGGHVHSFVLSWVLFAGAGKEISVKGKVLRQLADGALCPLPYGEKVPLLFDCDHFIFVDDQKIHIQNVLENFGDYEGTGHIHAVHYPLLFEDTSSSLSTEEEKETSLSQQTFLFLSLPIKKYSSYIFLCIVKT